MKVQIISDSTCDLSAELLTRYQLDITPLSVLLGDAIGKDGISVKAADIIHYVDETGKMAKTSAVNVDEYLDLYRQRHDQGYEIVQFSLSSDMSSSYKNACSAAEEVENVYVVDTRNLSTGSGLLVLHAAELAKAGMRAKEIADECQAMVDKVEASFVIDRLDYLYKGGRCSALSSFGANLLQIKPCIEVINGKMQTGEKYRGSLSHVLMRYVENRLSGRTDIDLKRIFITHSPCDAQIVQAVQDAIQRCQPGFKEIIETDAGAVVTSHCGPGTLGILFLRK